jgi:hypothetical protein
MQIATIQESESDTSHLFHLERCCQLQWMLPRIEARYRGRVFSVTMPENENAECKRIQVAAG